MPDDPFPPISVSFSNGKQMDTNGTAQELNARRGWSELASIGLPCAAVALIYIYLYTSPHLFISILFIYARPPFSGRHISLPFIKNLPG